MKKPGCFLEEKSSLRSHRGAKKPVKSHWGDPDRFCPSHSGSVAPPLPVQERGREESSCVVCIEDLRSQAMLIGSFLIWTLEEFSQPERLVS